MEKYRQRFKHSKSGAFALMSMGKILVLVLTAVFFLTVNMSGMPEEIDQLSFSVPLSWDRSEICLFRKGYVAGYNSVTLQPDWVAWHLTGKHAAGSVRRSQLFIEDPDVPSPVPILEDYCGSGYKKGAMCPADDNKWDQRAMYECFYLTNVCPLHPSLSRGIWRKFEEECRRWASENGDIYVVTGPIFRGHSHKTIGNNGITVPEAFFKVVVCLNGRPKGIGMIVDNETVNGSWEDYLVSIDKIEELTHLDFFYSLPSDIQIRIESGYDVKEWYNKQ